MNNNLRIHSELLPSIICAPSFLLRCLAFTAQKRELGHACVTNMSDMCLVMMRDIGLMYKEEELPYVFISLISTRALLKFWRQSIEQLLFPLSHTRTCPT
jgi:hypothetical protein